MDARKHDNFDTGRYFYAITNYAKNSFRFSFITGRPYFLSRREREALDAQDVTPEMALDGQSHFWKPRPRCISSLVHYTFASNYRRRLGYF